MSPHIIAPAPRCIHDIPTDFNVKPNTLIKAYIQFYDLDIEAQILSGPEYGHSFEGYWTGKEIMDKNISDNIYKRIIKNKKLLETGRKMYENLMKTGFKTRKEWEAFHWRYITDPDNHIIDTQTYSIYFTTYEEDISSLMLRAHDKTGIDFILKARHLNSDIQHIFRYEDGYVTKDFALVVSSF